MNIDLDSLKEWIDSRVEELKIPGFIVCVRSDAGILFHEAFGKHDVTTEDQLDKNAIYPMGSQSKVFTADLIHDVVEKDFLILDDKLTKFFPHLQHENLASVTVRDMLSHNTPLQWYNDCYVEWDLGRERYPTKEFLHGPSLMGLLDKEALDGNKRKYSNPAYTLLGQIIEDVTGKSYWECVKERFTGIDGLHPFASKEEIEARVDIPVGYYDGEASTNIPSRRPFLDTTAGSGGLYTTAPALTEIYHGLLTGKIPSALTPQEMMRVEADARGNTEGRASVMGLYDYERGKNLYAGKMGGVRGYLSFTAHHKELGITTSVVSTTLSFEDNESHIRYKEIKAKQGFIQAGAFEVANTFATALKDEPAPPRPKTVLRPQARATHGLNTRC
jgi:CubicO group peptidase (beta-lactamase class C family)